MPRYIDADRFRNNLENAAKKMHLICGVKAVDVGAIIVALDRQPPADVVPKTELDLLKSTITHKEEEAYTKGYADAKADILEKLQAEVERAETIAKYGDDFYEGKAEGVNAAMNCILSEGEE